MLRIGILIFVMVLMTFPSSSCVNSNGSNTNRVSLDTGSQNQNQNLPRTTITQEEVDQNRLKWRERGAADYDMTISLWSHGFVVPANSVDIKVRNGKFVSIKLADASGSRETSLYKSLHTIEGIFDEISSELSRGSYVKAEFDPEFGYPTSFDVSPRLSNANYRVRIIKVEINPRNNSDGDSPSTRSSTYP